jgi:hypothetical protein
MENIKLIFAKVWKESVETLTSPKTYFSAMTKEGGIKEPVIKAIIYGLLTTVIIIIGALFLKFPGKAGFVAVSLFLAPIFSIFILYTSAAVIMIVSKIAGGKTELEPSLRAAASLMVILPISFLANYFNPINFVLGAVISLVVHVYGLVLLYFALVNALGAKERIVKIALGIVLAVMAVLFFKDIYTAYRVKFLIYMHKMGIIRAHR